MIVELQAFISVPFIVLCVCISLIVAGISKIIEPLLKAIPNKYDHWIEVFYRETFLHILPIIVGILIALIFSDIPVPAELSKNISQSGYIGYCAVAGFISTYVFSKVKKILKALKKED